MVVVFEKSVKPIHALLDTLGKSVAGLAGPAVGVGYVRCSRKRRM